jgi:hypothetical protein
VTRQQAGTLRELNRYLAMVGEISLVLSLKILTGTHRTFFPIRPTDKGTGV